MKYLLAILSLVCASAIHAGQDIVVPWSSATIEFGRDGRTHLKTTDGNLSEVSVSIAGVEMTVPAGELAGILNPNLGTTRILAGKYYGGVNDDAFYTIVEIRYGPLEHGEQPKVQFIFFLGKYQELTIEKRTSPTTIEASRKKVGHDLEPDGVVEELGRIHDQSKDTLKK